MRHRARESPELRPEAAEWIFASQISQVAADLFVGTPLAPLVYDWLKADLKRAKWGLDGRGVGEALMSEL